MGYRSATTESKPIAKWSSEPYGLDYIKWSEEIARLSVEYQIWWLLALMISCIT